MMLRAFVFAAAALAGGGSIATRAVQEQASPAAGAPQAAKRANFGVGEYFEYDIRVGFIGGNAALHIPALDTVRGRQTYHAVFTVRGGIPGIRVNDRYDSWIDVNTISTLRYKEDVHEANYKRRRTYEFFPEQRRYTDGTDTSETVDRPVDQTSIFYLIRTLDLRVGLDTSFNNYFMMDRNPIRIIVLGRERVKVPAGEFDAVIVRPIIKAKGIFGEGGDARVWITDDDRRMIVQIKAKVPGFPFGGLNLFLKTHRPPTSTGRTP